MKDRLKFLKSDKQAVIDGVYMTVLYIQRYVYACVFILMPEAKSQFSKHIADNKDSHLGF